MLMVLHIKVSYCIGDPCSLNNEHQSHNLFMIFGGERETCLWLLCDCDMNMEQMNDGRNNHLPMIKNTFSVEGTQHCGSRSVTFRPTQDRGT